MALFQTPAANLKYFLDKNKQIDRKYFCYPKVNLKEIVSTIIFSFCAGK